MRKSILSLFVVSGLLAFSGASLAADTPMANGPTAKGPMMQEHHGPMMGYYHWRPMMMANMPVPMLMPIVWRNAIELQLTPSQEKQLASWGKKQRAQWKSQWSALESHNRALREALLHGETGAALKPLQAAVLASQRTMLQQGVARVEFLHKLLTPVQWQKVTSINAKMSAWWSGKWGVAPRQW